MGPTNYVPVVRKYSPNFVDVEKVNEMKFEEEIENDFT